MDYKELYELWLTNPYFDEDTRKELEAIKDDNKEIEDRFYKDLEFGTAGLRGVIGAGTNRMNIYTVRRATQGLANYIIKMNGQDKGLLSHLTQDICLLNLLMKQLYVLMLTELRHTCLIHLDLHLNFLSQFVN